MRLLFLFLFSLFFVSAFAQKRFLTIDNFKILVNTIGLEDREEGQPVIVLESGHGTPMDNWDRVLDGLADLAPVVAYDRPGIGESEPDDEMPTMKNVADKLVEILDQLEVAPPYVLVGHSLGGLYVRGFALYYPERLAGLVIIDPADFTETDENMREYYHFMDWSESQIDSMIFAIRKGLQSRNEGAPPSIKEEGEVLAAIRARDFEEIRSTPLPNIPVHIITGGRFDMPASMRSDKYDDEAIFRSKIKHRIARWIDVVQTVNKGMFFYSGDAGHFVQWDDPELVISSVRIVLQDYVLLQKAKDKK